MESLLPKYSHLPHGRRRSLFFCPSCSACSSGCSSSCLQKEKGRSHAANTTKLGNTEPSRSSTNETQNFLKRATGKILSDMKGKKWNYIEINGGNTKGRMLPLELLELLPASPGISPVRNNLISAILHLWTHAVQHHPKHCHTPQAS